MTAKLRPLDRGTRILANGGDVSDRGRERDLWFERAHVVGPVRAERRAWIVLQNFVVFDAHTRGEIDSRLIGLHVCAFRAHIDRHQREKPAVPERQRVDVLAAKLDRLVIDRAFTDLGAQPQGNIARGPKADWQPIKPMAANTASYYTDHDLRRWHPVCGACCQRRVNS